MANFSQMCKALEAKIQVSYEEGVTVAEAEKLAAEFLHAQLRVSDELKAQDLSARMRKSGLKAVRAAIYLEIVQKSEGKKPTESNIGALVDSDELVTGEQNAMDTAEVERDALERYYNVFGNCHIHFRNISKGNFGG